MLKKTSVCLGILVSLLYIASEKLTELKFNF